MLYNDTVFMLDIRVGLLRVTRRLTRRLAGIVKAQSGGWWSFMTEDAHVEMLLRGWHVGGKKLEGNRRVKRTSVAMQASFIDGTP
jgi:hypothetical protein